MAEIVIGGTTYTLRDEPKFLAPGESHYTSAILKQNPSVLVSIPESNQIVGASEVLKCNHPPAINFVKNKLGIN